MDSITELSGEEISLSTQEIRMAREQADKISLANTAEILSYGAGAQKKIAEFTEKTLDNIRSKDLGEVGGMLESLVGELNSFDTEEEKKGFFAKLFQKPENRIAKLMSQYNRAEESVDKIVKGLQNQQVILMKDVAMLDQMYELNADYFKELSMYILSGKMRLKKAAEEELPALQKKAAETGAQSDAQEMSDFSATLTRFEKRLHDLELTRMVALQMAPQIRLVQNNDSEMSQKIQSILVNTIPLWKSQMVLALGVEHSNQAAKASREISETTNMLLRKNAEKLKQATTGAMQESERGIVDISTLKDTNTLLIETIDEVLRIQKEGREKRRAATKELAAMEQQVREKLLEASR